MKLYEKQCAALGQYQAAFDAIACHDFVTTDAVRALDASSLHGRDREFLDEIKRQLSRRIMLKEKSENMPDGASTTCAILDQEDSCTDWLLENAAEFRNRFGARLKLRS